MLKKTITFNDLDGNEVTEDFYFHLSKAEIIKIHMSEGGEGGYYTHLKKMIEDENGAELIAGFDLIIRSSVGRRSEDGRRFIKTQEITDEFMQSEAYSEMFMSFIEDVNKAIAFINSVFPANLAEEVQKVQQELPVDEAGNTIWPEPEELAQQVGGEVDEEPLYVRENREPTQKELSEMSQEELQAAFAWKQARDK